MWDSDPDFIEYKPRRENLKTVTSTEANVCGLPEFVRADWVTRFLPTLSRCFGASADPWNIFSKGEETLKVIQDIVNIVFPGNMYRARWGDKIYATV